jgi:hypothetical protein
MVLYERNPGNVSRVGRPLQQQTTGTFQVLQWCPGNKCKSPASKIYISQININRRWAATYMEGSDREKYRFAM